MTAMLWCLVMYQNLIICEDQTSQCTWKQTTKHRQLSLQKQCAKLGPPKLIQHIFCLCLGTLESALANEWILQEKIQRNPGHTITMVWNHKWEQSYNPVFYFGKTIDTLFLNYCRPTWTKETLFYFWFYWNFETLKILCLYWKNMTVLLLL